MSSLTINMQYMRYINLFERISRVSTKNCFLYNNQLVFVVPKSKVSMAIGKNASNVRKMSLTLRKKIKVIGMPNSEEEFGKFVKELVEPIEFSGVEVKEGVLTIIGDRQARAMLIGRNRMRERELKDILTKLLNVKDLKFS